MADTKLSNFTLTASVDGTETFPILQAGTNKRVLLSSVKTSYLDTLYQPLDTDLTALAGLASAADKVPYFTGAGTASVADFTAAGRALVDDANAAAQCTTLGLGTGNSPTFAGVTLKAAAPSLTVIDSDTADADAGVSISASATTTTAGAEQVDATFTQQVAGSPVNFLVADADGSITLGDGTRAISLNGPVGDITIKDATPVLNFKDSSCTVSDVNAYIETVATDTGDGTEDADVYIYQQVNGSPFACFFADADGPVVIGYNGQATVLSTNSRVQSTAPAFKLIDTDATDGDEGVTFSASATATGAGAENVDLTITQQIAGSPVNVLVADADGSITVGAGARNIYLNGGFVLPYTAKTGTYGIGANDYLINCTANSFTVTLPTAVGCAGRHYVIKNSGTGTITIDTTSSQTIDGNLAFYLAVQYQSMTVVSDGANWMVI